MKGDIPNLGKPRRPTKRKSFALFLMESEIKPLVFVGRCMQYFGLGALVGFLLGSAAVYAYALFKPLPYAKTSTESAPTEPKKIRLHGNVMVSDTEPLQEPFEIGVLEIKKGPFHNGSFNIEVPSNSTYNIVVWGPGYQPIRMYTLDAKHDGERYLLDPAKPFPTNLGILQGEVAHEDQRRFNGFVEAGGRSALRVTNGKFDAKDLPLGKAKIKFRETLSGPIIHEEEIDLELTGPTPFSFIVP